MSTDLRQGTDLRQEEERISYLVTGFADGGLEESEKQELYELLRRPGEAGTRTARVAWSSLQVAVDLRGSLGTQFQDTVTHRLQVAGKPDAQEHFVPDVFFRLGITRPRLEELHVPVAKSSSSPLSLRLSWRVIALGIAGVLLLAWVSLHVMTSTGGRLVWSTGSVTRNGDLLVPGAAVYAEPVAVSAGGLAEISLENGGRIRIRGPASVVIQPAGVAVVSGEAWVTATHASLIIGLPDGRLALSPGGYVAIAAAANRATVATIAGVVVLTRGNAHVGVPLPAGRATTDGAQTFPWHSTAPATFQVGNGIRRLVDADPSCDTWALTTTHVPASLDDVAQIQAGSRILRLGAGWVELDGDIRQKLSGAPLLERALRLERGHDGVVRLHLDGLDAMRTIKWDSVPQSISGEALKNVTWSSGPAAEPTREKP